MTFINFELLAPTVEPLIKDTLGPATVSLSQRSKCTNAMGKEPKPASFLGRLSFSGRVLYQKFHCNFWNSLIINTHTKNSLVNKKLDKFFYFFGFSLTE